MYKKQKRERVLIYNDYLDILSTLCISERFPFHRSTFNPKYIASDELTNER
jgi:hypothetical protein